MTVYYDGNCCDSISINAVIQMDPIKVHRFDCQCVLRKFYMKIEFGIIVFDEQIKQTHSRHRRRRRLGVAGDALDAYL